MALLLDRPSLFPEDGLLILMPGSVGLLVGEGALLLPEVGVRPPVDEVGVRSPAGEGGIPPIVEEGEVPLRLEEELLPIPLVVDPSPCPPPLPVVWLVKLLLVSPLLVVLPLVPGPPVAPPATWLFWGFVLHLFVKPMLPSAAPPAYDFWFWRQQQLQPVRRMPTLNTPIRPVKGFVPIAISSPV